MQAQMQGQHKLRERTAPCADHAILRSFLHVGYVVILRCTNTAMFLSLLFACMGAWYRKFGFCESPADTSARG
jgi:hypothetical protein